MNMKLSILLSFITLTSVHGLASWSPAQTRVNNPSYDVPGYQQAGPLAFSPSQPNPYNNPQNYYRGHRTILPDIVPGDVRKRASRSGSYYGNDYYRNTSPRSSLRVSDDGGSSRSFDPQRSLPRNVEMFYRYGDEQHLFDRQQFYNNRHYSNARFGFY